MSSEMNYGGQHDYVFKIVLIGDSGVGKTCFMNRFAKDSYSDQGVSTIGVDFRSKSIRIDEKTINLIIVKINNYIETKGWDTAGQERFRSIADIYYRNAHGVILVYDITVQETYYNLPKWLADIEKIAQPDINLMIIGSKCDDNECRQIERSTAEDFCKVKNIPFVEASAKNAYNVDHAFLLLAGSIKAHLEAKFEVEQFMTGVNVTNGHQPLPILPIMTTIINPRRYTSVEPVTMRASSIDGTSSIILTPSRKSPQSISTSTQTPRREFKKKKKCC